MVSKKKDTKNLLYMQLKQLCFFFVKKLINMVDYVDYLISILKVILMLLYIIKACSPISSLPHIHTYSIE